MYRQVKMLNFYQLSELNVPLYLGHPATIEIKINAILKFKVYASPLQIQNVHLKSFLTCLYSSEAPSIIDFKCTIAKIPFKMK
jgi:hypothetical protein